MMFKNLLANLAAGELRTAVEVNKKRAKKSEMEYEELKALHGNARCR